MALAARHLASISDEKLQELRDRVDLVAVVQRRVPLKKSGRDWKGLCPFHGEKTSSFYVVPDKKMFHCFGCGVSGDAIKFVMQMEGRSFRDAVEQLAGEAGVDLTPPDPEEARRSARRAALGEVNEKACTFYERVLWEHPKGEVAREHLRKRGITEDTAKAWRLGYAPNLWDSLMKSHALKGVDPALVEEAGAKELVFVFDGDAAGLRAAQRASEIAAAQAVAARVLVPPGGEDPDETVLRVGIQGFRDLLAAAQPSLEFLLDRALGRLPKGAPVESRVRAVDAVRGIVQAAPSSLARDLYVEKVAEMVGAPPDAIRRALAGKAPLPPTKAAPARAGESAKPLPLSVLKAELVILAALVRNPTLAPELAHSGGVGDFVHPSLREAADAVCSGHDAQTAIRAVEPDSLRQRVLDALAEMEQAGDHTDAKRLSSLLKKHAQTVALERKQRASPRVPRA